MKRLLKCFSALTMVALVLFSGVTSAFAQKDTKSITVLFTHDLHSHLLPSSDENGGEYGGYARLMTAI